MHDVGLFGKLRCPYCLFSFCKFFLDGFLEYIKSLTFHFLDEENHKYREFYTWIHLRGISILSLVRCEFVFCILYFLPPPVVRRSEFL